MHFETFISINKSLSQEDSSFIKESLQKSYVFYGLWEWELEELIKTMFYGEVKEGEYLFK